MSLPANTILPGYPQPWGTKEVDVFDHAGIVNYQQATRDVIHNTDLGLGGFDEVEVGSGYSQSGTYLVVVLYPTLAAGKTSNGAIQSVTLKWFTLTSGLPTAEVTNGTDLSGESVRVKVIAPA